MTRDSVPPAAGRVWTAIPRVSSGAWAAGLARMVLLAVAYVAGAKGAFALAFVDTSIAPVWPPSGIALAAVLLVGAQAAPGVWLGALLFNSSTSVPLWVSAAIAVGNTLEALAGAWLLRRAGFSHLMSRVRDVLALAGLAALGSTAISASVGVGSLWLSGTLPASSLPSAWVIWWSGDAAGVLTVAPLLLLWPTRRWDRRPRPARVVEAAALTMALLLLVGAGLRVPVVGPFLVFPALVWAAVRFRQIGAAVVSLFIAAMVVWATARGRGPFVGSSLTQSLLLAQAFTGVVIATGLFLLAAVTAERDHATRLLDTTFERLPVGLVLLNPDLTLRRASRDAEYLLGVRLDPGLPVQTLFRRLRMTDLGDRPGPAAEAEVLPAALRNGNGHGEVLIARNGTGERVRLEYRAVPVNDDGGLTALALLFHDITALRRAEADRERAEAERQRLLGGLMRIQEDERRELAKRLHRDVIRNLTATLAQVDGLEQQLPPSDEPTRRSVRLVVDTLHHSLQTTRSLLLALRPPLLDTQGLVAAINQQLSRVAVETGMQTELNWRRQQRLDPVTETAVFRAAQEALANVAKHARASRLVVTGHSRGGLLTVQIADDGIGFSPEQHEEAADGRLGMRAMAERIQLAGGSLDVRSAPDAGTTISIRLPIRG